MAGAMFDIDIDDSVKYSEGGGLHHSNRGILEEDDETNGIDDIEIKDLHGPDFKAMNSSIVS